MLQELALMRGGHIAMPVPDGNLGLLAQVVQAQELVVDERLQWTHVDRADARGRIFPEEREDGEERRLGLSRCS